MAGMTCAGPRCTGSSCNRTSVSLIFKPRIGSSQSGPFWQAHLNPAIIMSLASRRNCIPFVKSSRMFLCSSRAQTFLVSSVGQLACDFNTAPIFFRPISSLSSPLSINSITFSSSGSTCNQNRLCLLGLFPIAFIPGPAVLSR